MKPERTINDLTEAEMDLFILGEPTTPSVGAAPDKGAAPLVGTGEMVGLLSAAELREILLTCDGRGKAVKTAALETLLNRRFPNRVKDMPASAYLDEEPNQ